MEIIQILTWINLIYFSLSAERQHHPQFVDISFWPKISLNYMPLPYPINAAIELKSLTTPPHCNSPVLDQNINTRFFVFFFLCAISSTFSFSLLLQGLLTLQTRRLLKHTVVSTAFMYLALFTRISLTIPHFSKCSAVSAFLVFCLSHTLVSIKVKKSHYLVDPLLVFFRLTAACYIGA